MEIQEEQQAHSNKNCFPPNILREEAADELKVGY
jgi:hypothetical protein